MRPASGCRATPRCPPACRWSPRWLYLWRPAQWCWSACHPRGCPLPTCQPAPESKPTCSRRRSFYQAREHFEAAQPPGPGTLADPGALEVRMSEDHLSRGAAVEQLHGNQRLATELLTGLLREAFPGPREDQFLRRLHLAECALADVLAVRQWNLDDVTAAGPNVEFHIWDCAWERPCTSILPVVRVGSRPPRPFRAALETHGGAASGISGSAGEFVILHSPDFEFFQDKRTGRRIGFPRIAGTARSIPKRSAWAAPPGGSDGRAPSCAGRSGGRLPEPAGAWTPRAATSDTARPVR